MPTPPPAHRWAILLAGGEGLRMRPLIRRWLGDDRPKQYCAFYGSRSMLEHTAHRAAKLVPFHRILTVIGNGHGRFLGENALPGRMIEQPESRDTGPGVFLAATFVYAQDPEALVVILPSDHFVRDESGFIEHADWMIEMAEHFPGKVILLGAVPDGAEPDYGWIEPGPDVTGETPTRKHSLQGVLSFHEKPSSGDARDFFDFGYLWNTMIIAAKVKALWRLGRRLMPEMMELFEMLRRDILLSNAQGRLDKRRERLALSHLYTRLRSNNFSRDLLESSPEHILVSRMNDVGWSDWGRPSRVLASLDRIGKPPNFPLAFIDDSHEDHQGYRTHSIRFRTPDGETQAI
jgi:mannose-1-phosphate guanylyltransferase